MLACAKAREVWLARVMCCMSGSSSTALFARNAHITLYDVTTWSWVNLVNPEKYFKRRKAGRGLGTGLHTHSTMEVLQILLQPRQLLTHLVSIFSHMLHLHAASYRYSAISPVHCWSSMVPPHMYMRSTCVRPRLCRD